METVSEHQLFGGAITCCFPNRFQNVSDIRQVPDNQEVYVDPSRDESIIIELLELKQEVADDQSAVWFLQDLANEQEAPLEIEGVSGLLPEQVPLIDPGTTKSVAHGRMAVSKARQGVEAANIVKIFLANIRLRSVNTDLLISVYKPLYISANSQSASTVGAGATIPADVARVLPAEDVFQLLLKTFNIVEWGLFC